MSKEGEVRYYLPPDYEAKRRKLLARMTEEERVRILKREAKLGHPLSVEGLAGYLALYEAERKAGEVLDEFGEIVGFRVLYLNFARSVHSAKRRCSVGGLRLSKKKEAIKSVSDWRLKSLKMEIQAIKLRFLAYNLNEKILDEVVKAIL